MHIYTTLRRGEYHLHHCEDYLFYDHIGPNRLLCAVMDGCTMGIDSYFAATLTGRVLRKIAKAKSYEAFYNPRAATISLEEQLKTILKELFCELQSLQNQLLLDKKELLSTLILLLADTQQDQALIVTIGDGVIALNGVITEYDQDNKPDYIGYHLSEDFEEWYAGQQQTLQVSGIKDISIATDGASTFTNLQTKPTDDDIDPVHYLLVDSSKTGSDDMLHLKLKYLEHHHGLMPTDDLAVIRLIHP
ncbi:stage II sporulation protein E (SpoIIE) [Chitinophaga agrisoli]|uniref:Stage II sporulation protein E (SpoIIE) n=1 Tax=Chitinophaga agrisoli TaxID=2607653 RepID=A0A5B2VX86_9BACT|nr:protein phosphatase 2C domain-containing protein [Chitinophaga agrisoli]KAA2243228.1 stage II sporulation protein E (SpoIIE) [Chitinophaga agrisoli]